MNTQKLFHNITLENKGLYYKLTVVFGLFFFVPVFGFLYFAVKYDILHDPDIPIFFIALLTMSFSGFFILRKIFDVIISMSRNASGAIAVDLKGAPATIAADELQGLVTSFQALQQELQTSFRSLEKKTSEIFTLKELSELCYITFNTEDLLSITLERALKLTNADTGSVLILEKPKGNTFIVEATIGQGEQVKKGDRVDYAKSIAKYAVINKSPLLVEDIETDIRFGRQSRTQFATKSFICMPLKTISDVIGVLTISKKKSHLPFTQADVDVLTPLLGNAAFTYDNLYLLKENKESFRLLKSMENISKTLNSSLRGSELFQSIFREMRDNIPYESAIILGIDKDSHDRLFIVDFLTSPSAEINRDNSYVFKGSLFDKVFQQQSSLLIEDTNQLSHPVDREFFINHGFYNAIITPLTVEDRIVGLLVFCNVIPDAVSSAHKRSNTLASTLALALERERLLFSMAKRHQELETIRQVGGALSTSTFDMEKVLTYTMDMIRVAMNVEAGALMLLSGNELKYEVAFNLDMKLLS
ncbi:MAG: GAF domain-containing protein [Deltaproteobacteria bacterium]|nr:GAF domain-containing protein [Deltaproteobacteria bacterium]